MVHQCGTCGKTLSRKEHLHRHMKNIHGETGSIKQISPIHGTMNAQARQRKTFHYEIPNKQPNVTFYDRGTLDLPNVSAVSNSTQNSPKTYSIQLTHPFGLLISGGTKTGKTTFVKLLLSYANIMIDPPPENIVYFYSEYQDTFAQMKLLVPGIQFVQGLPNTFLDSIDPQTRNLFIIDDMMGEKDAAIAQLFTKKSHHGNLSVIYIVQNLFHQSKDHRTISLNASYLVLTKNVRDASQVTHLAKQLYPNNTKFFQQAYQWATKEPFTYLFVDLTPTCPDEIRIRSGIFPMDTHYVYQPRE